MAWRRRMFGVLVLTLGLCGCRSDGSTDGTRSYPLPKSSPSTQIDEGPARPWSLDSLKQPTTARSQREDVDTPIRQPIQVVQATTAEVQQASPLNMPRPEGALRLSVRAWVNDKPIFDEEVVQGVFNPTNIRKLQQTPAEKMSAVQTQLFNEELEHLIDRELIYQDALAKLAANPKTLDKLKAAAGKEFDKQVSFMVKASKSATVEEFKRLLTKQGASLDNMRRSEEKNFIGREYVGSLIHTALSKVGHKEILEFYYEHINEFQNVDSVKWQNIFILTEKHQNAAEARRFADDLVARARQGEAFEKLLPLDEGDSWLYRKGDGNGRRKGEITPAAVEPYLFEMKDGDIGPLLEIPTGVHIFRLVKRDRAGVRPFDEKVQSEITAKLKNEIFNREYKRIVRDLRSRSVIEIMPQVRP